MSDIDLTLQQFSREDEEKKAKDEATALGMTYVNLMNFPVAPEVLAIIPEDNAKKFQVVSYLRDGETVHIATNNPQNPELQPFLTQITAATQVKFQLAYCSESSLRYAIALYKTLLPEAVASEKVEITEAQENNFTEEIKELESLKEKIGEVSTSDLLNLIFAGAMKQSASDVHIEPEESDFRLRFRVDGVLQDVAKLPKETYKQLVSRIKYLSNLKLDVTHPQDGRFEITVSNEEVDIRVSSLPASYGESIVMRLLPKNKKFFDLDALGFNPNAVKVIKEAISKPQGLILNTGPTGSGKTTTLYAILQLLNQPGRKIITLENPVEYHIAGIEQVQIDLENKTGFFDALKSSLRQDPDILMIGEIRDPETANIALQAAMTGHLVLSTLHSNNAPSSLARLMEMDIPPYLLAGSLNLIIGQRLVRNICPNCKGKGCEVCHSSGYKGRSALVETLVPGAEIEKLITDKAPLRTFEETARKLGMKTMFEDGMEKVAAGITTKEEVERVTKE